MIVVDGEVWDWKWRSTQSIQVEIKHNPAFKYQKHGINKTYVGQNSWMVWKKLQKFVQLREMQMPGHM